MGPTTAASMTPQGQATNSLQDVLSQITGMAQQAQQDPSTAVSNQVTQAANTLAPAQTQNITNQLTQQSGIPQLQGDQQNLGQIFGMYLADQNLASKYASPQLTSGTPPVWNSGLQANPQQAAGLGNPNNPYSSIKDPYLASPAAIIAAIMGNQSYSGAQTPGQNTSAMQAVPSSAQSVIGSIGGLINSQQGLVNTGIQNYQTQYQNIMNTLNNALTQTSENAFSQANNLSTKPGSLANAGSVFDDIVNQVQAAKGGSATEYDIWSYINQHAGALKDQGVNVNELWKLHKDMASKVGKGGLISGGKTKSASATTKYQLKKLPDGTMANFDPNTGKLTDPKTGKALDVSSQQVDVANGLMNTFDDVLNTYKNMNPIEQRIPPGLASNIPALAPQMATMNTKYFLGLEPELRKLVVGGRITVQEMKWLQNAVLPTAGDTPDSYATRINAAKALIQKSVKSNSGGGGSNKSDPLGIL